MESLNIEELIRHTKESFETFFKYEKINAGLLSKLYVFLKESFESKSLVVPEYKSGHHITKFDSNGILESFEFVSFKDGKKWLFLVSCGERGITIYRQETEEQTRLVCESVLKWIGYLHQEIYGNKVI